MGIYYCKVADHNGKIKEFIREAVSEETLGMELISKGYSPIQLKESAGPQESAFSPRRYSKSTVLELTQTLALLMSSGLSLKDALDIAQTIFVKGSENEMIVLLLEKLEKGMSFNQALEGFKSSFSPIYRGLIRIGEKIGSLDKILARLAAYLAENRKIKEKIIGALIYPAIIFSLLVIGSIVLVFFGLPLLKNFFTQFNTGAGQNIDQVLATFNIVVIVFCILIFSVLVISIFAVIFRRQQGPLAQLTDRFILSLPVLGKFLLNMEFLNFFFAMETLSASGYSMEESLMEASKVLNNAALRSKILEARERIIKGEAISHVFLEQSLFPQRIGRWLAIGEKSGKVDTVFAQLSQYYNNEIEKFSERFINLVGPVLIIFIGGIILLFIIFIIIPIYQQYGTSL